MRLRRASWPPLLAALAVSLIAAACSSSSTTASASTGAGSSPSGSPITLAFVTSLTGPGSPEFTTAPAGFYARLDEQNAEGGVNGHKLVPLVIDDQTSPTTVVTGVQDALSKGAFGIVSDSALFFLAAKYPQQQGVPVTGGFFDGPEWGQQPYTNMFAADNGSVDPKYPVNTVLGTFMRQHGGTVIGSYGYSVSPSSSRAADTTARSFQMAGGTVGVLDTSVPFGGVDFTSAALIAKQKHVDALDGNMDNNSNYALATAVGQTGVKLKVIFFPTGYEPGVIHSPVWQSVQGGYFGTQFRPFSVPNSGTQQMASALQRYQHFTTGQFPTFSQYEAWAGADLMIKGLELAGKNPTHATVIKDLRGVTAYNVNGLLPNSINYSTIFGHNPPETCLWFLQAQSTGFVPVSPQPSCGKDVPGTSTANS
jgi:branched-chain amino acid transport system substrate-binding protein